jgi:hypothetical protein
MLIKDFKKEVDKIAKDNPNGRIYMIVYGYTREVGNMVLDEVDDIAGVNCAINSNFLVYPAGRPLTFEEMSMTK